ncbi:hypothetical protein G5714_004144 [Onychostoma macrolepis]|uniref:Uncharacterized protein n=2 Tax=Onychostoma macrolepis TaxID=369639 RepID=A0A7J6DCA5_9TELE|nr:hypothetical protein G5714_004144 [Onychostoma macrolepis]
MTCSRGPRRALCTSPSTGIKQPVFAVNYIQSLIKAEAGGGWEAQANFKLCFPSRGAIELNRVWLQTHALSAERMRPSQWVEGGNTSKYKLKTQHKINSVNSA